jgi:hypothetical protein
MPSGRRKRVELEIDRDARVTISGYIHELVQLAVSRLQRVGLSQRCPDPVDLFDEVDRMTRRYRNHHSRLNDARINRRGARRDADPEAIPAAARPFAHHGAYVGAFPSVAAFAHACLEAARPDRWSDYLDLTRAGIDLHLGGRYWTVDADGVTYAFAVAEDAPVDLGRDTGGDPAPPILDPAAARAAMQAAGCHEAQVEHVMPRYAGLHAGLGDFAWHLLRSANTPRWLLSHLDTESMADDWAEQGALWSVRDPIGGVHVFMLRDPWPMTG